METVLSALKWLLILILLVAWITVGFFNLGTRVDFVLLPNFIEYPNLPLFSVLACVVFAAIGVFLLAGLLDQLSVRLANRALRKELEGLKKEIHGLRNLPFDDGRRPAPARPQQESDPEGV